MAWGKRAAVLRCLEDSLRCGKLRAASRQLRRKMGELRLYVHTQLLDGVLQPVVGGNLLRLADLDGLQVGQDDVTKQACDGIKSFAHEKILRVNHEKRTITAAQLSVIGCGYA
jgi:hypothetical protein